MFQESTSIAKKVLGETDPAVASGLQGIGDVHMKQESVRIATTRRAVVP